MRNEEGTNHQCCWHNIDSGTQESKLRESMVSWKPQDDTIKGEAANSERHSATVNQSKIIEKILLGFKKREKDREILPGILKQPLENALEFKGIQTLQVLEA